MDLIDGSTRIKDLITKMTLTNSYWGYLFSRIRRISDPDIPSIMAVVSTGDGKITLNYHPDLVSKTEDEVLKLVIEHEGMHVLNKHIPRLIRILSTEMDEKKKQAKMNLWGYAADCCVNSQIKNFPKKLKIAGKDWKAQFPELYKLPNGKAAEWYYEHFLKNTNFSEQEIKMPDGSTESILICDHGGWKEGEGESIDPSTLARRIENYTQEIAKQALKNFNKSMGRGTLPAGVEELINELLQPPKAPYYQIIQKLVKATRISKFKSCSTRINRKRTYSFVLNDLNLPQISPFPGKKRDFTFYIGILIDTSGSQLKEDILDALSGIKSIIENDKHCKVVVIENDTKVQKEYSIKRLSDIQFSVLGRGGTTLLPGLERLKQLNVDITLGFTDGDCENLNEVSKKRLPKKIIWAVRKVNGTVSTLNRTGFIVRI